MRKKVTYTRLKIKQRMSNTGGSTGGLVNSSYTTGDSSPAVLSKSGHGYCSRLSLSTIYVNHLTCILYTYTCFKKNLNWKVATEIVPIYYFVKPFIGILCITLYLYYIMYMYYIYTFKMTLNRNSSTVTTSISTIL